MTVVDKLTHMSEEEGQKQYSDMRSVDVGIGHYDYLSVTELCDVEILSDSAAECLNYRYQRRVGVYLIKSALFNVEDLSSKRKYCLELRVSSALSGTACGVSLYEIELSERYVLFLTVCKLSGKR